MPTCPYPQLMHSLPAKNRSAFITQKNVQCRMFLSALSSMKILSQCYRCAWLHRIFLSEEIGFSNSQVFPFPPSHIWPFAFASLLSPAIFRRLLKPDQILKLRGIIYHYLVLSSQEQLQVEYCCQMLCIIKLQSWENILRVIVLPKKVSIVK